MRRIRRKKYQLLIDDRGSIKKFYKAHKNYAKENSVKKVEKTRKDFIIVV